MTEVIHPLEQAPREDGVQQLVARASAGDEAAWHALYRRYRPLLSVLLRDEYSDILRARLETDDVLQSSFLAAFQRLPSFEYRSEDSFRNWLRMIVVHKLRDRIRQNLRRRRGRMLEGFEIDPDRMADTKSHAETPSRVLSQAERHAQVLEAMSHLPEVDQEILTLRTLERLPWGEICQLLEVCDSTARRRHRDALERLTRKLG